MFAVRIIKGTVIWDVIPCSVLRICSLNVKAGFPEVYLSTLCHIPKDICRFIFLCVSVNICYTGKVLNERHQFSMPYVF